jgi:uncharacterized protein
MNRVRDDECLRDARWNDAASHIRVSILLKGVAMLQERFIYFPEKAAIEDVVSDRLAAWPAMEAFRGLVAEPPGPVRGTAIVFHGNAGHAGHRSFYSAALNQLGLRVVLAEYPGYGPREGSPDEESLVADAQKTIELAHRLYGGPVLLIGESLGAGVVAAAGSRERDKIAGLLLITPWDRLEHVAAFHYPWVPVKWLMHDRYDSVTHLATFARPVVVVVADRDSIVPARFGEALLNALTGPKQLKIVKAAEHNDWFGHVDDRWWRETIGFLLTPSRS